jgi:hypothetical protein
MQAIETRLSREHIQAYRDAFREYQREARRLAETNAQASHDAGETERALMCVEHARVAYNETRDLLAASLMSPEASREFWTIPAASGRKQARVKTIAELLWVMAGRPQGTADDDWYRAERVVTNAAA